MGMQKQSLELLAQVQKIIDSYDFALTLRQIYYQLVAKQIIPNKEKYYKKLSWLCVKGRDEGILPEEKFVDRTRVFDKLSSWLDLKDFMDTVKNAYRKDKWQDQDNYIEIWTEKDALRAVINAITHKYDIGLQIARGQYPRTGIYETSKRYKAQSDKKCLLCYVGDYDPSGLAIYESIKERLIKYGVNVEIPDRVALTEEQIKKYRLPSDRAKKSDPNYKKFVEVTGSDKVVELDSLPPDILRKIIEDCIMKNIDYELLGLVQEKERDEGTRLDKFIKKGI
ncbi:hypothetical protein ES695_06215 [Candidatus Atribacteria bacterium 1244-E10-H5-B2]|nr:MAG: hypothetical protein ES695_06215 [Candidatus Atribacteria bacterium 1244-E10-H5-B2]